MEKSFEKHPAYREEDLEIKTPEELEEAKKEAGVTSEEESRKRLEEAELEEKRKEIGTEAESKEILEEERYLIASSTDLNKELNNLSEEEKKKFENFPEEIICIDDFPDYRESFKYTSELINLSNIEWLEEMHYKSNDQSKAFQRLLNKLKEGKCRVISDLNWLDGSNQMGGIDLIKNFFVELIGEEKFKKIMDELSTTRDDQEIIELLKEFNPYNAESFQRGKEFPGIQGVLMYKYCQENNIPCVIHTFDIGHAASNLSYLVKAGIISLDELKVLYGFDVNKKESIIQQIKNDELLELGERMIAMKEKSEHHRLFGRFGDLIIAPKNKKEGQYFAIKNIIEKERK